MAATSPDFDAAAALVEANSQQRADALGGDASALTDMSTSARRDATTGAVFSTSAAKKEGALRRTLATGTPLVVGSERLDIETGTISVELVDKKPLGNNTYDLTLREVADYPYVGEPRENAMGEAYERRVRMQANGPEWTILENEVPEGDWPLVEGAQSLGVPDDSVSQDPGANTSTDEEPPEGGSSMQPSAAVSRSGATSYALRHALN